MAVLLNAGRNSSMPHLDGALEETEWIKRYGPFDCPCCKHPFSNDVAYCKNCGKITTVFAITTDFITKIRRTSCTIHNKPAVNACCLCKRGVCELCYPHGPKEGGDFTCAECLEKCRELKRAFFVRLERTGICAKHSSEKRIGRCKSCGLPVCELCGYLWFKGLLFRKIVDGPFCSSCNIASYSGRGPDRPKGVKNILLQKAIDKGFSIPDFVYDA